MSVPSQIVAGATLIFGESLSAYPATTFGLKFILNRGGVVVGTVTAEKNGSDFVVTEAAAKTALWAPGPCIFAEIATADDGSGVYQVRTGPLSITPNFA